MWATQVRVFCAHAVALHLRAGDDVAPLTGASIELRGEGLRTLSVLPPRS